MVIELKKPKQGLSLQFKDDGFSLIFDIIEKFLIFNLLLLFSSHLYSINLAKLDDGLDESPTVMVGLAKQNKTTR